MRLERTVTVPVAPSWWPGAPWASGSSACARYVLARGIWLGLLFLVPAGVHFYLAYRALTPS